jgi:hypothetical protein
MRHTSLRHSISRYKLTLDEALSMKTLIAVMLAGAAVCSASTWRICVGFMEPEKGRNEFGWLDKAVELAQKNGLKGVLCTPSVTPP